MYSKTILKTIILAAVIVGLVFVLNGLFGKSKNITPVANSLAKIVDQNNLASDHVFSENSTNLEKVGDIQAAKQIIENNLKKRALVVGHDKAINQKLKQAQDLINDTDYQAAYDKLTEAIAISNNEVQDYLVNNSAAISVINASNRDIILSQSVIEDYTARNFYINGNWASATLVPNAQGDIALIVLKKDGNRWNIVYGPGTDFTDQILISFGVPRDVASVMVKVFGDQDYLSQIKI